MPDEGGRLKAWSLVEKFNRINCFFYLLFVLIQKVTKIPKIPERLSENFFKTTVLFFPRNRNSSFQKNWILLLRFLPASLRLRGESTSPAAQNRTLFCIKISWRPFFSSIKKIDMSEVRREQGNVGISWCVTQRRTTIGVRLEVGPLVGKVYSIICSNMLFLHSVRLRHATH